MITKMKKFTFLVYHKEYGAFLERLRELGVVHIVEKQRGEMDERLQLAMQKRQLYKNTLQAMYLLADKEPEDAGRMQAANVASADALVKTYEELQSRIQDLNQQLSAIDKDIMQMEVWGDFDWLSVRRLEEAGWHIQFYTCSEKDYNPAWEEEHNAILVKESGSQCCFVTVTPAPVQIEVEPVRMPSLSLSELHRKRDEKETGLRQAEADLKAFCKKNYRLLEQCGLQLQGDIDLLKVKLDSEQMADGAVVLLEGWVPEESLATVRQTLDAEGIYYETRDARRDDNAPVKLKNNPIVRMYEALTEMYGMPGKADSDPTSILSIFFTLFFAMCVADAGYGVLLIILSLIDIKTKGKLGQVLFGINFRLVLVLGIACIFIGLLFGTVFGVDISQLSATPEWLKSCMITGKFPGTNYDNQMVFALLIGILHISLAMTVKAINATLFNGFKESLSVWGWWLAVVGSVVVGVLTYFGVLSTDTMMPVFYVVWGVSAVGIYLLNDIHRNPLINIAAGLYDTYNMASGLMGDILSYIRLFALGLAGGILGATFNTLAMMVVNGDPSDSNVFAIVGFLLILVFGHVLNLAMSCLSAFVHPLRLSFVEYFKNAGYEGGGTAYKPFKKVELTNNN